MVLITIRLVGEEKDKLFQGIELDPQINGKDLVKMIESFTKIPRGFQHIEFRSEQVLVSPHPLESINDFEELVVKHVRLDNWMVYLDCWKIVNDKKITRFERNTSAHVALQCSKALEDSQFFLVYATFSEQWIDIRRKIMSFVDPTENDVKQSATTFFSKKYPNSKIDFKPKKGGTRAGIVVAIKCHDEETNYYMKVNHSAGCSRKIAPDLRELFAYRLLEIIGVGPVVFFPLCTVSTSAYCIATKEVEEFKELEELDDVCLQKKVVVEAYLLSLILGIRDLHEKNIGLTNSKTLSIIDFYVTETDNFLRRQILDDFKNKNNFDRIEKVNEILAEIGHEERMRIAKNALPNWSRINSMTSDIIDSEKNEMREYGIKFAYDSDDVEEYLQHIKSNYVSICSAFQ